MRALSIIAALVGVAAAVSLLEHADAAAPSLNPMPSLTKATYAGYPRLPNGRVDVPKLDAMVRLTAANTYNFLLEGRTGDDYLDLVLFLNYTAAQPAAARLAVWVTLIPPTETRDGSCSIAADSNLTAFNETAYFDQAMGPHGCNDYHAWGAVLGKLGAQFPGLVAVNIDDFTDNLGVFKKAYVAGVRAGLNAGGVRLFPTFYHGARGPFGDFVLWRHTYLIGATDGILFYFRNERAGQAMCRAAPGCAAPTACHMPCLYGNCSEASLPNFPKELRDFTDALALHRLTTPIVVGVYVSAYHSCEPGPSTRYDYELLKAAVGGGARGSTGAMVYTTHFFADSAVVAPPCPLGAGGVPASKACAVYRVFNASA
jgi:hypothetical protein